MAKQPHSPTKIYNSLRKSFRKKDNELLALTESQFKGAIAQHTPDIVNQHLIESGGNSQKTSQNTEMGWSPITNNIINELETLQLRMYFSTDNKIYDSSEKRFNQIIKALKPKKSKEHSVKQNPIKFFTFFAERLIVWSILKGEWKTLNQLYRTDTRIFTQLKQLYLYRGETTRDDIRTSLNLYTATDLAYTDVAHHFGLRSSDSVKNLISQWKQEKAK